MLRYLTALVAALACLGLAACGSDDEGDVGASADTLQPSDADGASGDVAWCIGKDTSGSFKVGLDAFNKQNPDLNATLIELPEDAGQQREQQVQRLRAESDECDVLGMDVIWTAEYAAQGWLYDLTSVVEERQDDFIPSTVETVYYEDKYWALPFNTNAGFLYYRSDQVPNPPKSWEDVYERRPTTTGWSTRARLRGAHGQLPRAALQRGGRGDLRGRDDVRDRFAGGDRDAAVHGRRGLQRRGAEGRLDLRRGALAARVRGRTGDVHAQLAVRLRAGEGIADRRQVRHHHVPKLRAAARAPARSAATTWRSRASPITRTGRSRWPSSSPSRSSRRR